MSSEYFVTADEKNYTVIVRDASCIEVNGKILAVDFTRSGENTYSLIVEGRVFSVQLVGTKHIAESDPPEQAIVVRVDGAEYRVSLDNLAKQQLSSLAKNSIPKTGRLTLFSPMPGLVVKIEVNEGDEVSDGDGLIILEAMKMENELKSTVRGNILSIYAKQGMPVEKGAKLLTIAY